eukprot:COSAG01_NODE_1351_length_10617_cov_4.243392_7_plen_128_part_00
MIARCGWLSSQRVGACGAAVDTSCCWLVASSLSGMDLLDYVVNKEVFDVDADGYIATPSAPVLPPPPPPPHPLESQPAQPLQQQPPGNCPCLPACMRLRRVPRHPCGVGVRVTVRGCCCVVCPYIWP